jgi:hypothetical protein
MATTTNFGWETPDDTDLVKDGALAIRTLGSAIDTSLVDLKGGTTGQVLSKTSNTDMDFTWVAQDDSNAIQNAIIDAKGDLIVGTAADTPARLAVGTNGHVLTADSAEASGMKWAAPAGGVDYDYQLLNAGGTALTGASTVTVSGISNKNFIHIIVDAASSASASSTIALRLNTDTGTNYSYVAVFTGSATGGTGNTGGDYIPLADMGNSAGNSATSIISIAGCNASGVKPLTFTGYATGSSSQIHRSGGATYKGTSTISSISIVSLSGNLDGGTVYVYGA